MSKIEMGAEMPVQWEHRLHTFKPITVGQEKINYWTQEGNKILVGFHGSKETYGEIEIGELLDGFNETEKTLFVKDEDNNNAIIEKVLPIISGWMGNIEILRESQIPKEKN